MIGRYNVDWIVGKNSKQIQARYGEFDGHPLDVPEDGLYRDCHCVYYVQVGGRQLFGDRLPDEFLYIYFDEEGIAYKATKFVDSGG